MNASASMVLELAAFRPRPRGRATLAGWVSFTASRTGWTDVGAPTVTARYCLVDNLCYFQVQVVPNVTVATVAGTSYITLPQAAAGITGDGSMMNLSTLIGIGNCVIDTANSRVYVPTQTATANTLTVGGWFEASGI